MRLKKSSSRLTLPDFDGNEFIKILGEFVKLEERWIPPKSEYSLYVRPFHIATDETLGVSPPTSSRLMIVAGPVGPYYASGFKPISLSSPTDTIRSAPLGTGAYKIGGYSFPYLETTPPPSLPPPRSPLSISKCYGFTATRSCRWARPTSSLSLRISLESRWLLLLSRTSFSLASQGTPFW